MELRHLRYFMAVAEEQNVTRAARRLHVSQPPLSRQIRDLEDDLGVELFTRGPRSLTLTEAGKVFLGEARAVLMRADQAVHAVRVLGDVARGAVHIGYAPSLSVQILPTALRTFETEAPGVRVHLHDLSSEECLRGLREGNLDLALTIEPSPGRGVKVEFEKLATYQVCCAVGRSHPLAALKKVSLKQLREERFIVYGKTDYPEYHAWLGRLFKPLACEPRIAEEYDSATSLIAAVEAGRGVALVPSCLGCLAGPRLALVPLSPAPEAMAVGATYRPGKLSRTAGLFLSAARLAAKSSD